MNIAQKRRIFLFCLSLMATQVMAIDFQKYTKNITVQNANETSQKTLLGIVDSCGNIKNLDDDCIIQALDRVAQEENNREAKTITSEYEKAITEGSFSNPECQTDSHMQANRTIGHCVLLLNCSLLENIDKEDAINQYEMCLQGGMTGLAYQGNLAAQYMLSEILREKNQPDQETFWSNYVKSKKHTDEYDVLMKCYGSNSLLSLN
ncbi:MAG: hypothetical protein HYX61_03765 [Gammaproteobacteria bacterium]|jgi:hypothetical protein|nr:hypothetical protein [Gammaproteobacteria bacterium]